MTAPHPARWGVAARVVVGTILVAGGVLLLGGVAWRYWEGARTREAARVEWNRMVLEAARTTGDEAPDSTVEERPLPGTPVARVIIERLGLDEVVIEGVTATELNAAPGHHPSTPLPGEPGNSVLSAHRDRHFFPLGRAVIGDTVITETLRHGRLRWRIIGRRVVPADSAFVLPTETPMLTLTTCWPIRHVGPAPDRLLLTAEPMDLVVDPGEM